MFTMGRCSKNTLPKKKLTLNYFVQLKIASLASTTKDVCRTVGKAQHAMPAVLQEKYNTGCLQDCKDSSAQAVCRIQGKLSIGCLLDCKESTIRDV